MRLTDHAGRRIRLRGQMLVDPDPSGRSVEDVVGTLVGVQAQDAVAAALAVRCRGGCSVAADVDQTREDRRVVLTWSLRGTRHLHRAADVRSLVGLLGPAFLGPSRRTKQLGIAGAVGERAVAGLRDALAEEGPLTRDQVKARLAPLGVDPTGQAAIHVVWRAAMEGLLCVVPSTPSDGERYALLDDWLGPADDAPSVPLDPGELARRYLAACGPATPDDFAAWSGLRRPAVREAWAAVAAEVTEVDTSHGPSWLLTSHIEAGDGGRAEDVPPDVRLLGAFDSILLAYADRRLHLSPDHVPLVNRGGGMVKPLVLIDGVVAGTWSRPRGRVEAQPFRKLTAVESAAVEEEVADVVRFLSRRPSPHT
jgi:hypothetical protein